MTGSETLVLIDGGPGVFDHPTPWTGLAIGAAFFLVVALLAWRRAGMTDPRPASRLWRMIEAAFIWSAAYNVMRAPGLAELGDGPFGPPGGIGLLVSILAFMITALLLLGTADLLLDALRPRRTLGWLFAGPFLLACFAIGFLAATGWMDIVSSAPGWRETMLVAGVLIAGLSWWSRLPAHADERATIFD